MENFSIIRIIMLIMLAVSMWFTIYDGPSEEKKEKKAAKPKKNPFRKV